MDCNSYNGITLLSVPDKVFARFLLSHIRDYLIWTQPEQAGFTPKRSTVDRILGLWVLIDLTSRSCSTRWMGEHSKTFCADV